MVKVQRVDVNTGTPIGGDAYVRADAVGAVYVYPNGKCWVLHCHRLYYYVDQASALAVVDAVRKGK